MAAAIELEHFPAHLERAIEIVAPRWIHDDEIIELERHYDVLLFERFADGTLLVSPPAGWEGGRRDFEIGGQVYDWARRGKHGFCMGSTGGVRLPDGSLFAPDATFVSNERWAAADKGRIFVEVVPDAAFEVLSKSDRVRSTMKKIAGYLRNGVPLVVLVDPLRRRVYVGREGDAEARDLGDVDQVDCSPVMPGFVLDVAAIRDIR